MPRECPWPHPDLLFRFSSYIPSEKTTSIGPKCPNTIGCVTKFSLCGISLFPSDHISCIKKTTNKWSRMIGLHIYVLSFSMQAYFWSLCSATKRMFLTRPSVHPSHLWSPAHSILLLYHFMYYNSFLLLALGYFASACYFLNKVYAHILINSDFIKLCVNC